MEGIRHRVHLLVLCSLPVLVDAAAGQLCYSAGGVAGIVVGTIVVTLLVLAVVVGAVWYLRKRRRGPHDPQGESGNPKTGEEGNGKFAFDNPYFRDDDATDAAEKGRTGSVSADSATSAPSSAGIQSDKSSKMKRPKMKTFSSVFNPSKKPRTMDDCFLNVQEPERITVSLRGHDFTGLGFNICGNMRDGIFVKDVLHRGPASESGKITAGDRILSVTVSLSNMVYEDALTILSYASPYDVQLELEKTTGERAAHLPTSSSMRRLAGSNSFSAGGQRLFHPLYRSQSIDDLTQIGKDSYPSHGVTPKRSQSIGMTAQRLKAQFQGNEDCLPEEAGADRSQSGSLQRQHLSADARLETSTEGGRLRKSSEGAPTDRPLPAASQCSPETGEGCPVIVRVPSQEDDRSLSRKAGKRKAPLPPRVPPLSKLETTAQVHHGDVSSDMDSMEVTREKPQINGARTAADDDSLEEKEEEPDPDSGSDVSRDSLEMGRRHRRVKKTSSSDRKASSLSDLTQLEESSTKNSPVLLERAVSMDLQQPAMPEGNLRTFGDGLLPVTGGTAGQVSAKVHKRSSENGESEWDETSAPTTNITGKRFHDTSSPPPVGGESPSVSSTSSDDSRSLRPAVPKRKTKAESDLIAAEARRRSKEVIEISESELDDVMMSHRQFLLRQAQATGHYGPLNPSEANAAPIQFENWSFRDSLQQRTVNGGGDNGSGHYRTVVETEGDSTSGKMAGRRMVPEVTTYAVRGSEGNLTHTVVITTTPDRNALTSSVSSHSPPPALQPPY